MYNPKCLKLNQYSIYILLYYRLEYYDVNDIQISTHHEYHMSVPDDETYKDLHGGMSIPDVTMSKINAYLRTCLKELDSKSAQMYCDR